jgi:hypothetical protein
LKELHEEGNLNRTFTNRPHLLHNTEFSAVQFSAVQ